jgi:hypothetical protein
VVCRRAKANRPAADWKTELIVAETLAQFAGWLASLRYQRDAGMVPHGTMNVKHRLVMPMRPTGSGLDTLKAIAFSFAMVIRIETSPD